MKPFETTMKILAALAAVAGVIFVLAAYGDKIVAWAKKILAKCPYHSCDIIEFTPAEDFDEETEFAPAAPAAEEPAEEVAAPAGDEPVAEETDFEA